MIAPSLKRLAAEAFEGAPSWFVESLLPQLNNFLTQLDANLSRGLTADDNLTAAFVEKYQLVTGATVANSFPFTLAFPQGLKNWRPRDVRVTQVLLPDAPDTVLTAPVWCQWDVASVSGKDCIRIRTITGLAVSTRYLLTFRLE